MQFLSDLWSSVYGWFASLTPEGWSALATWFAVAVAAVAAAFAWAPVRDARKARIESAQPQVVAFLDFAEHDKKLSELVIRNFGPTPAIDVRINSTPPIRRSNEDGTGAEPVWLPASIPFLASGQEWRTFLDDGPMRASVAALQSENRYEIEVTFGSQVTSGRISSHSVLDFTAHTERIFIVTRTMHHAAVALESISREARRWTEAGRRGGLAVYVRDGAYKDEMTERRHGLARARWLEMKRRRAGRSGE